MPANRIAMEPAPIAPVAARRDKRVSIVTPGYISSTPRVVREADALAEAGYRVRVVFTQGQLETNRAFDRGVAANRPWTTAAFRWSPRHADERGAFHWTRLRHRIARVLPQASWEIAGIAERAEGRTYPELARLAAQDPADIYIGHYPDGLAAAAYAARRHHALLGYDLEDLYADTLAPGAHSTKLRARILRVERRYVPRCSYVSAVSPQVAEAFAETHPDTKPIVVHNCHPWVERETIDGVIRQRQGPALSLYWFSQTIGLDRGIQDAIRAAGLLNAPVQIHLQGTVSADAKRTLTALAEECGVGRGLCWHEPVPPGELLSRAAEHDVGLALETDAIVNRRLAVTNKQFFYFLAGLAVAASDLPGQRGVMETCPDAGILYRPGAASELAEHLDAWRRDPVRLAATKRAALDAARTRWHWEREGTAVVSAVDRLLLARHAPAD